MRKLNVLIILFVMIISIATAGAVTQFKTSISPDFYELPNLEERAEFTLEIENLESETKQFRMTQMDPHWMIQSDPTSHWTSGITVPGRSSVFVNLYVKPSGIDTGRYKVILQIRPKDEQVMKKEELIISIPEPSSRVYQPAIKTEVEVNEENDPREPFRISIHLKNQNPLDITELRILVRSDSEEGDVLINQETVTSLKPVGESGDEKIVVLTKALDSRMTPKKDKIRVTLFYNHELVEPTIPASDVEIIAYSEIILSEEIEKSLLKRVTTTTYTNDGNVDKSKTIKISTGWFAKIFTKTSPESTLIKDEGKYYFVYDLSLKPDETDSITVSTNYRIPIALLIIIILIITGYFVFRSPIIITKEIKEIHKTHDGLSEVKVQLHIKNISAMTLEDVRIIDKIPSIAHLEKVFHIGTLEPSKIAEREKSGTVVKWEIDEIERFEERLIVYKIKTRLAVLGGFNLQPVIVRFKTPRGEIRRVRSKMVIVKT